MNRKMIFYILSWVLRIESVLMLLPAIAGLCFKEKPYAFLLTAP